MCMYMYGTLMVHVMSILSLSLFFSYSECSSFSSSTSNETENGEHETRAHCSIET